MLVLSFHFFLYGKFTNISDKKKLVGTCRAFHSSREQGKLRGIFLGRSRLGKQTIFLFWPYNDSQFEQFRVQKINQYAKQSHILLSL
jgi:hypothetical protein